MAEAEITTVSVKGQIVIPQIVREQLKIKPKAKLLVYGVGDTIILKKLAMPDVKKELQELHKMIDKKIMKHGELTEEEITEEVQRYRKARRR